MRKRLPPLFSLQAFEAAARQGNFSRAAAELNLTQGAVSRQIKQLEAWCGLLLFERRGPRVQLTQEGQDLLLRLGAPLNALHAAVYAGADSGRQTLHVATLASTARAWLVPRLAAFQALHPDIAVSLQTDYALVKLPPQLPQVALRYVTHTGGELQAQKLFDERLVVVATPQRARRLGADPAQWPADSLLRHSGLDWSVWMDSAGIAPEAQPPAEGMEFNDAGVMLDAAAAGLGAALSRLALAWPALQQGRLRLLSPHLAPAPGAYQLMYRADCADLPPVRAFCAWIEGEAAQWRAQLQAFVAAPG